MENNLPIYLQEVIYGTSDSAISRKISKLERDGIIRKIAPRLYSSNLNDRPEEIVNRNLFSILGNLYPGAVLSHRSAFEFKPTSSGQLFLTYKYTRKAYLPGVVIRFLQGRGHMDGDISFSAGLYVSQRERAFLENLQVSRKSGPDSKTLTIPEIEERLESVIRVNGEQELNKLRDRARLVADELGMQKEFQKLNNIIGAILSTKPSRILKSPVASARVFGIPYDPARTELFEVLFRELNKQEFKYMADRNTSIQSFRNFAFFEAYFSNYIEGTVFSVEDARQIIETRVPMASREEDSHDVLGTYQIVSNQSEMRTVPGSAEETLNILKYRHEVLLSARKERNTGRFKDRNNFAGNTAFVDMNLVQGTLLKSFDYYKVMRHPFARAAYMMFVISEVHPFMDGNGRLARVMMNAELVNAEQTRIIIPTVFRDDYLGALRRLSRQGDPEPYIRMLSRAREFSSTIVSEDMDEMQKILEESNAFLEHTEGKLKIMTK